MKRSWPMAGAAALAVGTGAPARGKGVARLVLALILIPPALFILNAVVAPISAALR
jgi:hypothetical protein